MTDWAHSQISAIVINLSRKLMFDGFSIYASSTNQSQFEANEVLDFNLSVSERTGEIMQWKKATNRGVSVYLHDGKRPRISGSVLKRHNNGEHNYNNLYADDIAKVLNSLSSDFGIDPQKEILTELEITVTLTNHELPNGLTVKTVNNSMIAHKGAVVHKAIDNEWYYQIDHSDYIIKPYNKGLQYGLPYEVFRFEKKVLRMRYLQNYGIHIKTLADLLNRDNYPKLGRLLIEGFKDIVFFDPAINIGNLEQKDRETMLWGMNKMNWAGLSEKDFSNTAAFNAARKKKERKENKFRALNNPPFREVILLAIEKKWVQLTGLPVAESLCRPPKLKGEKCRTFQEQQCDNMSHIPSAEGKAHNITGCQARQSKMSHIPTLYVAGNCDKLPVKKKRSIIEGRDLKPEPLKSIKSVPKRKGESNTVTDLEKVGQKELPPKLNNADGVLLEIVQWVKTNGTDEKTLLKIKDYLFSWNSLPSLINAEEPVKKSTPPAKRENAKDSEKDLTITKRKKATFSLLEVGHGASMVNQNQTFDKYPLAFNVELNSRTNKDGLYSVFLRITRNRKSKKILLRFRIPKQAYNSKAKWGKWIRMLEPKHVVYNREIESAIDHFKEQWENVRHQGFEDPYKEFCAQISK